MSAPIPYPGDKTQGRESFPDAEAGEDFAQNVLHTDLPDQAGKLLGRQTHILRYQLSAKPRCKILSGLFHVKQCHQVLC